MKDEDQPLNNKMDDSDYPVIYHFLEKIEMLLNGVNLSPKNILSASSSYETSLIPN